MARQVATEKKTARQKASHLMCGTPVWGIAGLLTCFYLAYLSYVHVRDGQFDWPHDAWFMVSYAVWILLMAGLLSETRCWRERIFFGLVLANFLMGFAMAAWSDAPAGRVRDLREVSAGFWGLAGLAAALIALSPGDRKGAS